MTVRGTRQGFSVLELLVAISIIAVLCAILLPALSALRRRSQEVACASALQQLGVGFSLYAVSNRGWWPMSRHDYAPPGIPDAPPHRTRTRLWHDFISGYIGDAVNLDGNRPLEIARLRDRKSVLWGCRSWEGAGSDCGYAMNIYPGVDAGAANPFGSPNAPRWVCRYNVPGLDGWYFKASLWSRPSERALLYDSVSREGNIFPWPWWSEGDMPRYPSVEFTGDFNRHGARSRQRSPLSKSINTLFCDGHVQLLSAKELSGAVHVRH